MASVRDLRAAVVELGIEFLSFVIPARRTREGNPLVAQVPNDFQAIGLRARGAFRRKADRCKGADNGSNGADCGNFRVATDR
ncbi:hypothetical protein SPKIRA_23080 [Sphingomonas paucimobilis]|uniref:DNA, contig: SP626 n=1 Tax=Sphingomonas paucimobilis NBRC 13935 TaxID=1219050 RepID=A0A0C9M2A1_SPHPI|nr:hypothetical protein SPKIRA_23080 [Sphingomonas paucimobilis]GAN13750.1 hypothetical protein SP6_26_00130 [Sphingomonas paucimobilis NBRC 13935]